MRVRKITSLLMAVLIVALLSGCGGASEPAAEPTPAEPAAEQPAEEAAKVAPVEIGEPATSGDWTLKAKSTDRVPEAGGAKAPSGQELLVITFDLTNGSATDQGTGPTDFKLTGADGTAYDAVLTSDPEMIFNTPMPIKAGETREIKIAYGVPKGMTPFQWTFSPFVEGGAAQPAVVNIP